jgi:pilus assembly protein Flp/PilA
MHSLSSLKKNQKGQGLVEYALILVLVAIVVIAALLILGPIIGNVFSKVNSSLSGVGGEAIVLPTAVVCTPGSASIVHINNHPNCVSLMNQNHCSNYNYNHASSICSWY